MISSCANQGKETRPISEQQTVPSKIESMGGIEEPYEVKTFTGYRNGKRITVRLLDLGTDCDDPTFRFVCKVEQEDGKTAQGNNAKSPDVAASIVHWSDLD
jgi:hypothetical protein